MRPGNGGGAKEGGTCGCETAADMPSPPIVAIGRHANGLREFSTRWRHASARCSSVSRGRPRFFSLLRTHTCLELAHASQMPVSLFRTHRSLRS